ncbi:MAG: LPS-assembly protein LptD [Candidatus Binataceae bacterium]
MILAILALAFAPARAADFPGMSPSTKAEHAEPINVTGRETTYDSKADTFLVSGDAVMTQGGSVLKADQIELFRKDRTAVATGNVHLIDTDVEIFATDAKINLANETLELDNATVKGRKTTYHMEGKKIRKLEGQNYEITSGFFTTCGCDKGAPDWALSADEMDVNVGGEGEMRRGTFDILGYPLPKIPYATFPANTTRHSGLISGREGESGLRGFQWLQPYYIAIDKSQDATVALDVETSQRVGGLGEYRLTNGVDDYFWVDGAYYNESLRSQANRETDIVDTQLADDHIPIDRYGLIGMTRQHITDNLIAYGDGVTVSDNLYLREMNVWTLSRGFGGDWNSLRNAMSRFGLLDEYDDGFARIQGTWNQDLVQPNQFALQQLPQALLSGRTALLGGLAYADYDAEAVNFYRDEGVDGGRLDANPRVTLPWRFGDYATGFARAGVQTALYDTSGDNIIVTPVGTAGRLYNNQLTQGPSTHPGIRGDAVPYVETGISTDVERVFDINGDTIEKLKNTIEPFANYTYVPTINQNGLPLFDQIDRLNSRSLLSYGFTTRLFAKMTAQPSSEEQDASTSGEGNQSEVPTVGPLESEVAESESLAPTGATTYSGGNEVRELAQFTLLQDYDILHDLTPNGGRMSDIEGVLTVYPTTIASLGSQVDFSPTGRTGLTFANVYMNFQPPWSHISNIYMGKALEGSFVQASYNYVNRETAVLPGTTQNANSYLSLRAYSDVFDRLGVYVAPDYNFAAAKLLSAEYGARLKSPCNCWAADMGIVDSFNPNEVQVQFQLTLGGLGSIGQSPFGRNPFQTMGLAGSSTGVLPR